MKRSSSHLLVVSYLIVTLLGIQSPPAQASSAIGFEAGSMGLGVVAYQPIRDNLNLRLFWQGLSLNADINTDSVAYEAEAKLNQFGISGEWHPIHNGFFINSGLIRTQNKILLDSETSNSFQVGNDQYIGNIALSGSVIFAPLSPFFSVGWNSAALNHHGFSFNAEIGFFWQDSPEITLQGSGTAIKTGDTLAIDVSNHPTFQKSLKEEQTSLEEETKNFKLFPVLNLGFSYQF